jgi:hypothetical protein
MSHWIQSILDALGHITVLRSDIRRRLLRINIEIPDDMHARLKMIASAEGRGFYEWLKDNLTQACPDEQTLLEMLADIMAEKRAQKSTSTTLT